MSKDILLIKFTSYFQNTRNLNETTVMNFNSKTSDSIKAENKVYIDINKVVSKNNNLKFVKFICHFKLKKLNLHHCT